MTEFEIQPLAWVVKPKGASLFANGVTTIKRDDEGDGQFIVVSQCDDSTKNGEVRFDVGEWPQIQKAVEMAINEILADELHEFKENAPPPDPEPEPEPTGEELVGKVCWVRNNKSREWRKLRVISIRETEYRHGCENGLWYRYAKLYREGVEP